MYLERAVANACCFWWEQTNGHAFTPHSFQAHTSRSCSPPHAVSLVSVPFPTLQKTPVCSFQFFFSAPFPSLVLNCSINYFYQESTGRIWGLINSLNFKFQVSNRNAKILKSSRLSHHKLCGCCTLSPQKLFALLAHEGVYLSWYIIWDANIYRWHRSILTFVVITRYFKITRKKKIQGGSCVIHFPIHYASVLRDLFMSFSINKYLQHYQGRQKEHPVVKQSGRLVEMVLEVIIITYIISTGILPPHPKSYSLNHKITTRGTNIIVTEHNASFSACCVLRALNRCLYRNCGSDYSLDRTLGFVLSYLLWGLTAAAEYLSGNTRILPSRPLYACWQELQPLHRCIRLSSPEVTLCKSRTRAGHKKAGHKVLTKVPVFELPTWHL